MAVASPAHRTAPRRAPQRPAKPDLRVVGRRSRRPRRAVLVVGSMLVVFAALLASAVFHAVLAQGQQRLDRSDQHVTQAQDRYDQLRLEHDRLLAPDRIVSEAQRLGMVTPDSVEAITPAAGTGASVGDVPGADATDPLQTGSGYPAVKPYLGATR